MGAEVPVQASGGFVEWIMVNGQVVAFVAQILYWLFMIVLLAYAVWQYKRWVNFQLGTGRSGALRAANNADAEAHEAKAETKADKAVDVEEFVE